MHSIQQRVRRKFGKFTQHIGPVIQVLPPSFFYKGTQVFRDRQKEQICAAEFLDFAAAQLHTPEVNGCTHNRNPFRFPAAQIAGERVQFPKCAGAPDPLRTDDLLLTVAAIDPEMSLMRRSCIAQRKKRWNRQLLCSLTNFVPANTYNQPWRKLLLKQLETVRLAFNAACQNQNHIADSRRVIATQKAYWRLQQVAEHNRNRIQERELLMVIRTVLLRNDRPL